MQTSQKKKGQKTNIRTMKAKNIEFKVSSHGEYWIRGRYLIYLNILLINLCILEDI
jgi:hypothetical protein